MGEFNGERGTRSGPGGIDITTPSVARVYDAVLNGKDNYAADRAVRDELVTAHPEGLTLARDNRDWLIRVVRYLASTAGVDQFLDCGSGLPTAENTHQVAQRANPDARVVYVDNDPIVAAHGRALLVDNENTEFTAADVREPRSLLDLPEVDTMLDWDRPLALLMVGVLHHVLDEENPEHVLAGYVSRMPPGSFVAISHFYNPGDDSDLTELAGRTEQILLGGALGSGRFRSRAEIETLFRGLDLIPPGVGYLADWWPDGPQSQPLELPRQLMLGGLATTS